MEERNAITAREAIFSAPLSRLGFAEDKTWYIEFLCALLSVLGKVKRSVFVRS
jgi:hypothetical protein